MPPTFANGKICYIEMPATDIARSADFGGFGKYLSIALLISTCIASTNVWGQATAEISGTARDQSGAVLPGVENTRDANGNGRDSKLDHQ